MVPLRETDSFLYNQILRYRDVLKIVYSIGKYAIGMCSIVHGGIVKCAQDVQSGCAYRYM